MLSTRPERRAYKSARKRPVRIAASRSRLVAARIRALQWTGVVLPTENTARSSMARNSLACSSIGSSPISSRNRLPPCAARKKPSDPVRAPEKASAVCPKNCLSARSAGIATQFSSTRRPHRSLCSCSACTVTSLPTLVSPRTRIVASWRAICAMRCRSRRKLGASPISRSLSASSR